MDEMGENGSSGVEDLGEGSSDNEQVQTVDVGSQLDQVIQLQQVSVAMVCVIAGLILAVSLIQIFKRYL